MHRQFWIFSGFFIISLSLLSIFCSSVDLFLISLDGESIYCSVVPIGTTYQTRYIHSVQKTPVEDEYKLVNNAIWLWEERVISHNAGLPVEAPRNGKFFSDEEWMHFRGGRIHFDGYYFRIGTNELGKNSILLDGTQWIPLYKKMPGARLKIFTTSLPLLQIIKNGQIFSSSPVVKDYERRNVIKGNL